MPPVPLTALMPGRFYHVSLKNTNNYSNLMKFIDVNPRNHKLIFEKKNANGILIGTLEFDPYVYDFFNRIYPEIYPADTVRIINSFLPSVIPFQPSVIPFQPPKQVQILENAPDIGNVEITKNKIRNILTYDDFKPGQKIVIIKENRTEQDQEPIEYYYDYDALKEYFIHENIKKIKNLYTNVLLFNDDGELNSRFTIEKGTVGALTGGFKKRKLRKTRKSKKSTRRRKNYKSKRQTK
jgi:hypothetical protein